MRVPKSFLKISAFRFPSTYSSALPFLSSKMKYLNLGELEASPGVILAGGLELLVLGVPRDLELLVLGVSVTSVAFASDGEFGRATCVVLDLLRRVDNVIGALR